MPQMFASLDEFEETENGLKLTRTSAFTRRRNTMVLPITAEDYRRFQEPGARPSIQDFFPNLAPDQREFLLTGVTPEEWNDVFGDDEE